MAVRWRIAWVAEVQELVKTYEKKIDAMLKEKAEELTSF